MTAIIYFGEMLVASLLAIVLLAISRLPMSSDAVLFTGGIVGWTLAEYIAHRFVLHDRDSIYAERVDRTLVTMGLTVLKTPVRAPQANAFCEGLIGTIRRECLDFMITTSERHVRAILREWVRHDNRGRPHASVGPGIPEGSLITAAVVGERPPGSSGLPSCGNADPERSSSRIPS